MKQLFLYSICLISIFSHARNTPGVNSPANGSQTWSGVTLDWSAVSGSQAYQIQIDTSPNFSSPLFYSLTKGYINTSSLNTDTEHYFNNSLFGVTYFWRVRAYAPNDTSAWATNSFTTRDFVTVNGPANGSIQWTGLTLDWSTHVGVWAYDVQVDTTQNFNSTLLRSVSKSYINNVSSNTDTEWSLGGLNFGITYFWRVRARNGVDTTSWSSVLSFTTRSDVSMNAPANNSTQWTGLTLDWGTHIGVGFYDVELDTSPTFNSTVYRSISKSYINSVSSNTDTEWYINNLFFNTKYYWRVRVRNTGDTAAWMPALSFTTRSDVSMNAPANNSIQWTGLTLDWGTHIGVGFYDVELDTSPTFNSTVYRSISKSYINSVSSNTDTEWYINNLFFNTKYYWRVRVRNAVDTAAWMPTWSFVTRDDIPLVSPAYNAINVSVAGINLDWSAHVGVGWYQVQIDTAFGFNSPALVTAQKAYINSVSSNTDTYHLTGTLQANRVYYWRVRGINTVDSSSWTTRVFNTGSCLIPAQPTNISGQSFFCLGDTLTYTLPALTGATNYVWSKPIGWIGNSNTNGIILIASNNTGAITVRGVNGCGSTEPVSFVVSAGNVPEALGLIASQAQVCQGSTFSLSVNPVSNARYYQWQLPSGLTGASSTNSIQAIVSPTASSGQISVVAVNGCGSSLPSQKTISVNPKPIFMVSPNAAVNTCSGDTVTFTAIGDTGLIYRWKNNGIDITNATFSRYKTTVSGVYSLVARNAFGCLDSSASVPVNVNAIPTITASTPAATCGTGTVVLGATASAGIINWYSAATGGTSLGTGASFTTPSISATTNYFVDATANGCTTATRTSVAATVNAIPTITASTPAAICGTGTVVLGATASAGTINWYSAATGGTSLATGASFTTPSISATTNYFVDATANGCTTATRTSVAATVNAIPTITANTPASRCGTGTVVLGATASAGAINWYAGATGGTSLGTGASYTTPSISATTNYFVDATANGCTTATRTSVAATINARPITSNISGRTSVHADTIETYAVTNTTGSSYVWTVIGGIRLTGGTTNSITVDWDVALTSGMVKVIETNTLGCKGDTVFKPIVSIVPVELLSFDAKRVNEKFNLTWVTASEINNSHFEIERSLDNKLFERIGVVNGIGNSTLKQTYIYIDEKKASSLFYRLKQVDFNGKSEYSKIVGVYFHEPLKQQIHLYPNPNYGVFGVDYFGLTEEVVQLKIYNAFGQVVYQSNQQMSIGNNSIALNCILTSGIYVFTIDGPGISSSARFLVK